MITHGISTGALFILAGVLYERIHTRDINRMGGFWKSMPFLGVSALVFAMASLGLPGLGNFVAEFLTLVGAWQATHKLTIIATIGLVAATAYSLRIVQKVFLGTKTNTATLVDLNFRERLVMVVLIFSIVWLGLFPQKVLDTSKPTVKALMETSDKAKSNIHSSTTQHEHALADQKGGNHE
jgi:NADH-quinone oxidoreductase subunit M